MVLPLKQVAGARLGQNNKPSMTVAKGLKYSATDLRANQRNGFAGPVAGYSDPKVEQNEIEKIRDWQTGGEEFNKNKEIKNNIVGQRLSPKKQIQNQKENGDLEEDNVEEYIEEIFEDEEELRYLNSNPENPNKATPRKMLGGIDFLGVLIVTIVKDALDVFLELLAFIFDILIITGVLGIILWFVSTIADFTVLLITQGYLLLNDVPMNKKKASIQGLTLIIEAFPFLGILPLNTISMVYMKKMVNAERKQEEIDEQKKLDEEFELELNKRREALLSRRRQTNRVSKSTSTQTKNSSKNKDKEDPWKKMVDESNQNITKENIQQNPKLK